MALLNVVNRIEIEAEKISALISDLQTPAQNPAYEGPTKGEIIDTLKTVLDVFASAQIEIEELNSDLNYWMEMSDV